VLRCREDRESEMNGGSEREKKGEREEKRKSMRKGWRRRLRGREGACERERGNV